MSARGLACGVVALVAASCSEPSAPERTAPDPPPQNERSLQLFLQPISAPGWDHPFVGGDLRFRVAVYDAKNVRLPSADAEVSISDPLVANLSVMTIHDIDGKPKELEVGLDFVKEGTLKVIARLGSAADTFALVVGPRPPLSTTVQVDSFAVIEHHYDCPNGCYYVAYSPVVRLSNQATSGTTSLVWARVSLGGLRSSRCAIDSWMVPGETREYGRFHDYLWDNGILFVAGDERIQADSARFEMVIRSPEGRFEMVEATGPLIPLEAGASPPGPSAHAWGC